jgi:hypothetical protein
MLFDSNTPTTNCTVQGLTFIIAQPFVENQPLKANEADSMNQLLIENCRNNFASTVDEMVKERNVTDASMLSEDDKAKLQQDFTQYVAEYEFGVRRGGQRIADPVVREAREIGKSKIRPALIKAGVKAADITAEVMNAQLDKYWPQHGEKWMAQARQIIALRTAAAEESLEVDASGIAPAA